MIYLFLKQEQHAPIRLTESRLRAIIREEAAKLIRPNIREAFRGIEQDDATEEDNLQDLMYDIERVMRDPHEDLYPTSKSYDNEEKIREAMSILGIEESNLPSGFVKKYARTLARTEGASG